MILIFIIKYIWKIILKSKKLSSLILLLVQVKKMRLNFGTMMTNKEKTPFSSFLTTNRQKLHQSKRKSGQPQQKSQKHSKVKVNHNKFRKKEAWGIQLNKSKGNQSKLRKTMKTMKRRMMKKKASTERKFKPKKPRKKRELPSSNMLRTRTSTWRRIH